MKTKSIELENTIKNIGIDKSTTFSGGNLKSAVSTFIEEVQNWREIVKELSEKSKALDFEQLYSAAEKLFEHYEEEKCPLCDTPYEADKEGKQVITNPKEKVKTELEKLKELKDFRQKESLLKIKLKTSSFQTIKNEWQKIRKNLEEKSLSEIQKANPELISQEGISDDENQKVNSKLISQADFPDIDFASLESKKELDFADYISECEKIFIFDYDKVDRFEAFIQKYKEKIHIDSVNKSKYEEEIKNLSELLNEFDKIEKQHNEYEIQLKGHQKELQVHLAESDNAVKAKKFIEFYTTFRSNLDNFKNSIIFQNTQNIDNYVLAFYRAFNIGDNESEKIKTITIPKNETETLKITFEIDDHEENALARLSEGHLRTLGLAVLMARALKHQSPFLVFDDAINAIDSDHRDNISRLFSNKLSEEEWSIVHQDESIRIELKEFIENTQLIITTHDRFFDETIANMLPRESQLRYVLCTSENGINFVERNANFEAKIAEFLSPDVQDIRSAIFYCRIWMEEVVVDICINKKIKFDSREVDKNTRNLRHPDLQTILRKLSRTGQLSNDVENEREIKQISDEILNWQDYPWFFNIINQESHYRRIEHIDVQNAPTSAEVRRIFEKAQELKRLSDSCAAIVP